ncbi:MAG: 1-deoxy-D-xylulose-5-phosphate reductoisomerase [Pirellulales bacterium]
MPDAYEIAEVRRLATGDAAGRNSSPSRPLNVAVLGSTGSIGGSTLEVAASSAGRIRPWLLAACRSAARLAEQAREVRPAWVVVTDEQAATAPELQHLPPGTRLAVGQDALCELVQAAEVDRVVSAIVGAAGLASTWAALEVGKTVALANKETLVMAGPLVMQLAARQGAVILPVDSEHSAIMQALRSGASSEVRRLLLTASGGPFRTMPAELLATVTPQQALAHPTWSMGPKITIDSATMMNKALELIEARWLFDIPAHQIDVVVHPQSIVHSMVEFVDGSVVAQLSPPDMKLPIQLALDHPQRHHGPARRLDWSTAFQLAFEPPDVDRFPALILGREAASRGGTAGAVLNAANEIAVQSFLDGEIPFTSIAKVTKSMLDCHPFEADPTLDDILRLDAWARQEARSWINHHLAS